MVEDLNPETLARIDDICRKVSVAHSLDEEIQDELRGHMEDKVLAYLNGRERLREDDALLLVREHFGDPANVKSLMQDVHVVETQVSLARRLAAIVAVQLVYMNIVALFVAATASLTAWFQFRNGDVGFTRIYYSISIVTISVFATLIYWRVLVRWEHGVRAGKRPWFHVWHGGSLVTLLAGLVFIKTIIPMPGLSYSKAFMSLPGPVVIEKFCIAVLVLTVICHAIVWLWWCDRPPRTSRTLTYAAIVWLVMAVVPWQDYHFVQLDIVSYDPLVSGSDIPNGVILWQEHKEGVSSDWVVRVGPSGFPEDRANTVSLLMSLVACIFIVAIAKFVYVRLDRRRGGRDEKDPSAFV